MKQNKYIFLWRYIRPAAWSFVAAIVSVEIATLTGMLHPQIIRAAIDCAIGKGEPHYPPLVMNLVESIGGFGYLGGHLWIMALAIVACAIVQMVFQYAFRVINTKATETMVKTMRNELYSHIQRLPYEWHTRNKTGDIIQRCTSDVETIKGFVSNQLASLLRVAVMLGFALFFMIGMNGTLTLIAMLPLPIIVGYSIYFHKIIEERFMACDENEGKLSAIAQENLTGVRVVRAFGREAHELDKFVSHNKFYTSLWVKMAHSLAFFWCASDVLSGLQLLLLMVIGVLFCINGRLTAGEYIAFIAYNGMLIWPIRELGRTISEMGKTGVSIERIRQIIVEPEERDTADAVESDMQGDIVFDHVSFGYHEGSDVLKDVSFTIPAHTTLGILGGTGSGKSTLILLLDKMYSLPEGSGTISVGGRDIRTIKTASLRKNIGVVLQESFLFSRTIAENIGIGMDELDMKQIEKAADAACLSDTISGFTDGYDTTVGERGVTLSGGQRQRTAIARCLVGSPPILIFDDSLSAVDTETDARIRAELERRFGTATVILISHRITTLSRADHILVLDKGRVSQYGTPEELRNKPGIYRQVYEAQTGLEGRAAV